MYFRSKQVLSGAEDRNRTDTPLSGPRIFLPLRLSPPDHSVCGLDYPFTLAFALGAARLVSTPSETFVSAWLGIASKGFPEFEQFYSRGFPWGTQVTS